MPAELKIDVDCTEAVTPAGDRGRDGRRADDLCRVGGDRVVPVDPPA